MTHRISGQKFLGQLRKWKSEVTGFYYTRVCFEIRHGENIPAGYGWAGYNEATDRVYVLPLGLNYLYTIFTWIYHEIWRGMQSRAQSYTYMTGRKLGEVAGYQVGYMRGYVDAKNGTPNKITEIQRAKTSN